MTRRSYQSYRVSSNGPISATLSNRKPDPNITDRNQIFEALRNAGGTVFVDREVYTRVKEPEPATLSPDTARQKLLDIDLTIQELRKLANSIRRRCTHDYSYSPDPSGNNDSGYVCRACGNEVKHLPK